MNLVTTLWFFTNLLQMTIKTKVREIYKGYERLQIPLFTFRVIKKHHLIPRSFKKFRLVMSPLLKQCPCYKCNEIGIAYMFTFNYSHNLWEIIWLDLKYACNKALLTDRRATDRQTDWQMARYGTKEALKHKISVKFYIWRKQSFQRKID